MEKNKKILIWSMVLLSAILAFVIFWKIGANNNEESFEKTSSGIVLNENWKRDFFIETKKSQKFDKVSYLEKTAKVISGEDITLVSQANGKIKKIYVKEWDKVATGQKIANLVDSIWNYGLNLDRANLWVEWAKIDYSSQQVNLNKAVDDASINLEKVQNEYNNTKKSLEKTLSQAKLSLDSSKNVDEDTTLSLQLQKLSNTLAKTELDVANLKQNNIEQLKSFNNSTLSTYDLLDNLMIDIIDFSDGILWITPLNKRLNDKYEDYLWLKNSQQLSSTKQLFKDFTKFKLEKFNELNVSENDIVSLEQYEKIFVAADKWYEMTKQLLKEMTKVLDNSLVSVWSLDQWQINNFKAQINGFETQTQQSYSAYLSFKSSVRTFLNTYKNNEKIAEENLKLLEDEVLILEKTKNISWTDLQTAYKNNKLNYEKAQIETTKNIRNLEISLKNAKLVYKSAKQVRDVTLRKMNNAIKLSKNTRAWASKEYAKLGLKSSIFWVVTDIFVDEWQDVNVWSPIAKISNLKEIEAEIWLSKNELTFVKVWQKVVVNYSWKQVLGKIKSISPVADNNLTYKTTIEFSQKFKTIGWLVEVQIPVKINQTLIPLNIVEVTWEGKWVLQILSWSTLWEYAIDLWKVWWDKIEVTSKFQKDLDVIVTNLSNYDEVKFDLKLKEEVKDNKEKDVKREKEKNEEKDQ